MSRHVLTDKAEATLETSRPAATATRQPQEETLLHVRTRLRAGAMTTETRPPSLTSEQLCPA